MKEKGGERFEDLRRMMGDTKRRTGRKVAVVRSVERTGERSQQRDRIVVGGTEEDCLFWDKIEGIRGQDRRDAARPIIAG